MTLQKKHRLEGTLQTGLRVHLRKASHVRELTMARRGQSLQNSSIVVVMVIKDEAFRLPHMMNYYRQLGADHFIVIDNQSTDATRDLVLAADDATLFQAAGAYRAAHYGIDWVNLVLAKHCIGKWIVHVDSDEYLVWSTEGELHLPELCRRLDKSGLRSLQAIMVDMYSDQAPARNSLRLGQDPLEVTSLFDPEGYSRFYDPRMRGTWIKGGVRGRHFFPDDIRLGPALNKTPLVRWQRGDAFVHGAHELWPRHLNGGRSRPGLALLHFKFTSQAIAKVTDEGVREQHTEEYNAYADIKDRILSNEATRRFENPQTLVNAGLIESIADLK